MSLLGQTARYLLLSALIIALLGAVSFYAFIHREIRHEVDEILMSQLEQTKWRLQQRPTGAALLSDWDDNPHIERTTSQLMAEPRFEDVMLPDSSNGGRQVVMRQIQMTVLAGGQPYRITIRLPYHEFNELARELSGWIIMGFLGLMTLSVLVGLGLSSRLWRPFYETIDRLNDFRLDQPTNPVFPGSRVREFGLLSRSLSGLTEKLRQQFSLQRQFTENASHELQTPLAVASAELELLIQSDRLTESDWAHLQRATDALGRLSQLNRSLLLLTQVENNQFAGAESVDMSLLVTEYTDEYEPFFAHKHMSVERAIAPDVYQRLNRQLAIVLLTNLLKNAVRHGCARHGGVAHGERADVRVLTGDFSPEADGGHIGIVLTPDSLTISNTGKPLPFAADQLFNRFVKDPARPDSTGLGLALVKQITDRYGLPLTYAYDPKQGIHTFRVGLRPNG